MRVFLYIGILSSVLSILMFALNINLETTYAFTTHGVFVHPNTTSILYIIIIPLCIYFYSAKRTNFLTTLILMSLFIFVLLFTYSRAGYIGAFSALFIFAFLSSKSKQIFILVALLFILIASVFVIDFVLAKQDSSYGRLLLLLTAYDMVMRSTSSFLWGYGVYTGVDLFKEEKVFFGSFEFVDDPHNFILLSGIQFGVIIALIATIFIIVIYIKFFLSDKKKYPQRILLNLYLCISITSGLLINNMLEDIIVYPEYYVMPVFLIFLGYLYYSVNDKS